MNRQLSLLCLALIAAIAWVSARAEGPERDERGWLTGPVAANAQAVISGISDDERPQIELPKSLLAKIDQPTVIFYFSPTCPHCRAVAVETQALSERLRAHGAEFLWVSSGSASEADLAEFQKTYGVKADIVTDTDREIVSAIGARSTPSALLVEPLDGKVGKTKVAVRDIWYPYVPGFDTVIEGRVAKNPFAGFESGRYVGTNACGACHVVEHMSWGATHHAVAWYTLEKQGKTTDAECTGCHVTGNGQPTGWNPADEHSKLTDVGCEACHGPGGPHDGETTDAREQCATCHDAKHSIAFSVDKGVPLIDHFFADHLTEAEYDDRRRKLFDGSLPRELLAFEEGAQLGAAACQECHPEAYESWAGSPHANAMASLAKDDKKKDAACVKCHATAKQSGPPPSEISEFHILDGVGCESCHGPGEKHAANPTTENIEALGEDCPVCVIEAVCTSCHTQEWDPTWDLETKLPKVGHGPK